MSALSKGEAWKEALQLLCELPERGRQKWLLSFALAEHYIICFEIGIHSTI